MAPHHPHHHHHPETPPAPPQPRRGSGSGDSGGSAAALLIPASELPPWFVRSEHIHSGYRRVTPSLAYCAQSLGYLHNETANIYTHLVPCVVVLAMLAGFRWVGVFGMFSDGYTDVDVSSSRGGGGGGSDGTGITTTATTTTTTREHDRLVVMLYLATSAVCFAVSAAYHTLMCHSQRYAELWLRLDYVAILGQILGSFISGLYIGFYCEPGLRMGYWGMITTLTALTLTIVLDGYSSTTPSIRLAAFVATGLSAFAPILHAVRLFPSYAQLDAHAGLSYYYVEGAVILLGAGLYGTHYPECRARSSIGRGGEIKGRYDIWGASHQLFHVCVVAGAAIHLAGLLSAFRANYEDPRC